jgi:hypothetical protein
MSIILAIRVKIVSERARQRQVFPTIGIRAVGHFRGRLCQPIQHWIVEGMKTATTLPHLAIIAAHHPLQSRVDHANAALDATPSSSA